jgi:enamine deaminase RidA (YjgF/YER057c/UK114 family)
MSAAKLETPHEALLRLGITLPAMVRPVAAFVPAVRSGNLVFVSGHIARKDGRSWRGKVGAELTVETGKEAARAAAIDALATLDSEIGLGKVKRIVKLLVLVNSTTEFTEQHLVANGASELFAEVFGEAGAHARSAFGVAQIPFGSAVELEVVAEV